MNQPLRTVGRLVRLLDVITNLLKERCSLFLACFLAFTIAIVGCRTETKQQATTKGDVPKTSVQVDKYWQNAKEEVYKSVLEILAQHQAELERGIKYHKLIHGDRTKRQVAITFDDGPHPDYTPKLLEILRQYEAKATFFVVGKMAEKYPNLVKEQVADGHSVGNHTYHHVNLTRIPKEYIATEIKACGEVLRSITGKAPRLFRPPGGDYDKQVAEVAEALGYTIVLWSINPGDYADPGEKVIETLVLKKVRNGDIILLHDGVQETIDVLPQILGFLKDKGYQLVTVDEMMGNK
ncbi:MAG: polysaccharide deacetylase family protein [Armatimonadota bacterium]|nr:polysaccharide deacetylase family protein [Armatimonadota bacterium]